MGSDTRDITLLRGIVEVALIVNGIRQGWRDLGEVDKLDMPATELSNIDVFSSRDYSSSKIKSIPTKKVPKLQISGLELNGRNTALHVLGFSDLVAQDAGTGTDVPLTDSMEFGLSYDLGFENVSGVTIAGLTEDTDFTVDADLGRVVFLSTGTGVEGNTYTASFTYGTASTEVISIAGAKEVHCAFRYTGAPRPDGDFDIWYDAKIWHAQLQPADVLSLITAPGASAPAGWSITAEVLGDEVGQFGGSTRYPYGQLFPRRNTVGS